MNRRMQELFKKTKITSDHALKCFLKTKKNIFDQVLLSQKLYEQQVYHFCKIMYGQSPRRVWFQTNTPTNQNIRKQVPQPIRIPVSLCQGGPHAECNGAKVNLKPPEELFDLRNFFLPSPWIRNRIMDLQNIKVYSIWQVFQEKH